jgi:outer membrane protein assembly factor BamB
MKSKILAVLLLVSFCAYGEETSQDWPQWMGPQRDGIWRETGILESFPANGPTVRWRVPIGGGFAGPVAVKGKIYVTDKQLANGASNPADPFKRGSIPGTERVLCLNDADGSILWKHEYDCPYTVSYPAGPRTTPVVSGGKVFTLGAEGHLVCLDAEKGTPIWQHDLKKDYTAKTPLWGFSANLLVDGQKVISLVGGEGSAVVAFDKDSGKELWKALNTKEIGYASPVIYEAGGTRQLIIFLPDGVHGLDPETGKPYWSQPYNTKQGLTVSMPAKMGDMLFFTSFYNGPLMLRLDANKPATTEVWRGTSSDENKPDRLHSIIPTPFMEDGYIYGVCSYGQFRCLKAETGEQQWETFAPTSGKKTRWGNAFITKNGDRFFLASETGDLVIAKLSPKEYTEVSRAHLLEPTGDAMGRKVVWSYPAYANRCVYARNDKEIVCASLAAEGKK